MKYRIKINELNNGCFEYVPQVYLANRDDQFNTFIQGLNYPCWVNLKYGDIHNSENIVIDLHFNCVCESEEDAIQIIKSHKKNAERIFSFKIKKTIYKEII